VCAFFMGYSIDFSRFSTPTGVGSLSHRILNPGNSRTFPREIPYYLALTLFLLFAIIFRH
ncbi:hypothetical protein AALA79_09140, partial [Lachnospiraceae bacterium 64-25]